MEGLHEWVFSICAAMVVCGIALQIMPKSNLAGIFKLVVSVFFLCVLLSPIIIRFPNASLEIEEKSNQIAQEKAESLQRVIDNQTQSAASKSVEKIIAKKLQQMGIKYHGLTINITTNGQSETDAAVEIILDEEMRPNHEKIAAELKNALQMDVLLGYEKKE